MTLLGADTNFYFLALVMDVMVRSEATERRAVAVACAMAVACAVAVASSLKLSS